MSTRTRRRTPSSSEATSSSSSPRKRTRLTRPSSLENEQRNLRRGRGRSGSGGSSSSGSSMSSSRPGSSSSAYGGCGNGRRSVRHSVERELPDGSISALYPLSDNYISDSKNNTRSPKLLSALCVDAVCRSLPDLDGTLPPGLPQDIVDAIVKSLIQHAALNATTLSALRHCELSELSLAGCRGVHDEWLKPLSRGCSFRSESTAVTMPGTPPHSPPMPAQIHTSGECYMDAMDLGQGAHCSTLISDPSSGLDKNIASNEEEASACSTATFHSASSTHHHYGSNVPGTPIPDIAIEDDSGADIKMAGTSLFDTADHATLPPPPPPQSPLPPQSPHAQQQKMSHHQSFDGNYGGPGCPPSSSPSYYNTPRLPYPSVTSQLTLLDLRGSRRLTDRGLLQLSDLRNLEIARLDDCHSLTGRGLVALSESRRLNTLSLANCRRLTDEAIVNISHLGESLVALSLDGCRCITDRSLEAAGNLYRLEKLDLTQCDLITDDGLDQLAELEHLEELSLGWCRSVTDRGLGAVSSHAGRADHLRVLRLARCPVTDQGVGYVGRLKALEELDLNGCSGITSAALGDTLERLVNLKSLDVSYCPNILRSSWQGKIKSLRTLELCYSSVRDVQLSRLTSLPSLEELNLDSCPVGDWALSHLADNNVVPNLTALDLADTDLTDLGMVHLPKFEKMTKLSLFYCNITNSGLRHLAGMTTLEVLNLDSRDIGDEGLAHLRNLTNLKSLDVFSGRITDAGCVHLSRITSLESLELCGGGVGDLGCAHLATCLENLTSLNLSQNERITNRGAASLAALTNLRALNLSNTRVSAGALRFLGGLVRLQSLALYGCQAVDPHDGDEARERLDALQRELPSLRCLRLNSASEDDGVVAPAFGEDDDDEVSDDSEDEEDSVEEEDEDEEDSDEEEDEDEEDSDEEEDEDEDEMALEHHHANEGVAAATMHRGDSSSSSDAASLESDDDEDDDDGVFGDPDLENGGGGSDASDSDDEDASEDDDEDDGEGSGISDDDMDGVVAYEDANDNDDDMSLRSNREEV